MKRFACVLLVAAVIGHITCDDDVDVDLEDFELQGIQPAMANGTVSEHIPYMASIRLRSQEASGKFGFGHFCGGVFVSRQHVLTLASCLSRSEVIDSIELEIVAGTRYRYDALNAQTYLISKFVLHPDFAVKGIPNNLAILFVSLPAVKSISCSEF